MVESVIRGDTATLKPSSFPNFNASAITKESIGPGDRPATSPRIIPENNDSKAKAFIMPTNAATFQYQFSARFGIKILINTGYCIYTANSIRCNL
jgi:hypothetical protein